MLPGNWHRGGRSPTGLGPGPSVGHPRLFGAIPITQVQLQSRGNRGPSTVAAARLYITTFQITKHRLDDPVCSDCNLILCVEEIGSHRRSAPESKAVCPLSTLGSLTGTQPQLFRKVGLTRVTGPRLAPNFDRFHRTRLHPTSSLKNPWSGRAGVPPLWLP